MRALDWRGVLSEHGIGFVDRGPNVKRGEINIRCPFCGAADPSHHMGLNLESGFWACWRNSEHRGKSPLRLLVQLLNLPYWRARQIAGLTEADWLDPDGFDSVAARIMGRDSLTKVEHARREFLALPSEFKELYDAPPRFYEYLREARGFGTVGTRDLGVHYGLRWCSKGAQRDRIILPYFMDGELLAWTGRAIGPAQVRYRDLDHEDCLVTPKSTLYNLDCRLDGGAVLVVVEGPLDALKIDVFGRGAGVRAVALSTNSISDDQLYLLEDTASAFTRVLVMMDQSTDLGIVDSMRMKRQFASLPNAAIIAVPYGLKDAAEMSPRQATHWALDIIRG